MSTARYAIRPAPRTKTGWAAACRAVLRAGLLAAGAAPGLAGGIIASDAARSRSRLGMSDLPPSAGTSDSRLHGKFTGAMPRVSRPHPGTGSRRPYAYLAA